MSPASPDLQPDPTIPYKLEIAALQETVAKLQRQMAELSASQLQLPPVDSFPEQRQGPIGNRSANIFLAGEDLQRPFSP
jgi:hypothetical protein